MNNQMYSHHGMNYPRMSTAPVNYPTNNPPNNVQMPRGMNYSVNNPPSNTQMSGTMNYATSSPVSSAQMQGGMNYSMSTTASNDQMQEGIIYPSNDLVKPGSASIMHSSLKKSSVKCTDCNLDFTSQIVLDAHLQGSRHAKQMKSKTILESLEKTNVAFSKDDESNGLKCDVCNVFLNSIQQLQTHLNGNRHKKKISKGDWDDKEVISKANLMEIPSKCLPRPPVKNVQLMCKSCRKYFNSQSQLDVHLRSQKHQDRVSGKISEKAMRYSPYYKARRLTSVIQKPLTNNFVSGGFQQYA